uniref:Uncharacterized protein n=1 Tax=Oryza sativa subsp. japonica TaxID=39947 RepID=Q5Z6C5_ORYSJ|nr:hypothetical protein [Oryza sativa Japonica Group]BAD61927.1 hypothetical protein [Oryza sativa Japonica Group]
MRSSARLPPPSRRRVGGRSSARLPPSISDGAQSRIRSDRLAIVAFSGAPLGAAASGAGPPRRELVTVAARPVHGNTSGARVAAVGGAERLRNGAGTQSYATTDDDALEPVNPATRSLASYSGHAIATSSSGLPRATDEEDDGFHTWRSRCIVGCDGEYHRRHSIEEAMIGGGKPMTMVLPVDSKGLFLLLLAGLETG